MLIYTNVVVNLVFKYNYLFCRQSLYNLSMYNWFYSFKFYKENAIFLASFKSNILILIKNIIQIY